MGNVTAALKRRYKPDKSQIMRTVRFTMSASYATGGDTIPAGTITKIMPSPNDLTKADVFLTGVSIGGYTFSVDLAAGKVKAFLGAAEVGATTNLSAVSFDALLLYESTHWIDDGH